MEDELFICGDCGDPCTGDCGDYLTGCSCNKWICNDCIDEYDDLKQEYDDEYDKTNRCRLCVKSMEKKSEAKRILELIEVKEEFFKSQTQFLATKYKEDEQTTLIIKTIYILFDDLMKLKDEYEEL